MNGAVFQNNHLCGLAEANEAENLRGILVEMSKNICARFPESCINAARKNNQLVTEQVVVDEEESLSKLFYELSQRSLCMVHNAS